MNETAPSPAATTACSGHPFVSIVLCTVGNRPSLERCLDSLVAQGCQRSEILLVWNGQFDPAYPQRVSHYPVRLLHEPRRGVSTARNTALGQARGEILAIVDDDIVAHPHWLHELLKGFTDPSVACAVGRVVPEGLLYSEGPVKSAYVNERALSTWTFGPAKGWYREVLSGAVTGFGCNMAFRKNFLERCSRFPEDLGAGSLIGAADENYLFFQVLQHGFRIHHTSAAVVTHFFEGDKSQQKARQQEYRAAAIAFYLKLLMEEKGHRWETLQYMVARGGRFLRASVAQNASSESSKSSRERFYAYLRGVQSFWKSRRQRATRV